MSKAHCILTLSNTWTILSVDRFWKAIPLGVEIRKHGTGKASRVCICVCAHRRWCWFHKDLLFILFSISIKDLQSNLCAQGSMANNQWPDPFNTVISQQCIQIYPYKLHPNSSQATYTDTMNQQTFLLP